MQHQLRLLDAALTPLYADVDSEAGLLGVHEDAMRLYQQPACPCERVLRLLSTLVEVNKRLSMCQALRPAQHKGACAGHVLCTMMRPCMKQCRQLKLRCLRYPTSLPYLSSRQSPCF